MAMLRAYVRMLPRLKAEDALATLSLNLMGSGYAKPEDVRSFTRTLQREAAGGETPAPKYDSPRDAAQAMGLKVRQVPKVKT